MRRALASQPLRRGGPARSSFVVKNMPAEAPGSLSEPQYWAILAFDLEANGVDVGSKHLDGTTAASVVIHP
jgi:hypothetical protein